MSHPVVKVKALVGALAYVYGVTRETTHSCSGQLMALQRDRFMADVMIRNRFERTPPKADVVWHDRSQIVEGADFDVDLNTFQVTARKAEVPSAQSTPG